MSRCKLKEAETKANKINAENPQFYRPVGVMNKTAYSYVFEFFMGP